MSQSIDLRAINCPNLKISALSADGVVEVALHSERDSLIMNDHVVDQLSFMFAALNSNELVKAILLTGTGSCFSRTAFVPSTKKLDVSYFERQRVSNLRLIDILSRMYIPKIAALNGPVAVGADYLILFDSIYASETVDFVERPKIAGGLFLGDEGPGSIVDTARSKLGNDPLPGRISAAEMKAWGLIDEILPAEKLMPYARLMAESPASCGMPE